MSITKDEPSKTPVTITIAEPGEDLELKAAAYMVSVLRVLNPIQQRRVLNYLVERNEKGAM